MTLVLRYSARSDRGLVRQNNQDAVYAGPRLLALADGMGGHAAGEVASSLVISALAPLDEDDPGDDLLAELRHATVEGNAAITRHIADAPDLEGMGTTLTAILFAGSRLGLVHVGDSRADTLRAYRDPRECADRMIDLALRGGGPDNITCIVADVVDIDFGEDAPIMGGSAGDGSEDGPPPDSAAARASATTLTRTAPQRIVSPPVAPAARRRGRLRLVLAVVAVLAVLVAGGVLARMWVMQQYYVGADAQRV